MKKILIVLAAVCFVGLTSSKCSSERKIVDPAVVEDTLAPTPSATDLIVMVYSNAYDGFLNVREQPDVKSPIIGKILNGPMGAVKMGEVGGWTIVKVGDKIGYASSRYLQTEPTPEFTDKDMEKCLLGVWVSGSINDMDQRAIILYKNGILAEGYKQEGWIHAGEWSVNGNILNIRYNRISPPDAEGWSDDGTTETWTIVNGDVIKSERDDVFAKQKLMSKKAYAEMEEKEVPLKWYEFDAEHLELFYEQAHLRATGSFPSGE